MSWITTKFLFIYDRDITSIYHIWRLLNNCFYLVKRLITDVDFSLALWKSLIVYKEKYEKSRIGCWKCYSCNDINRLSHTYRMWRLLFAHLYKTCLRTNSIWLIILVNVFYIVNVLFFTSVAHPLLTEWVHGLLLLPHVVHATISFGAPASRRFSPWYAVLKDTKNRELIKLNTRISTIIMYLTAQFKYIILM